MASLYEISDLSRVYAHGSHGVRAVDRVDLTVEAGELLAIEGTSGSGKSTLLAMLGGLDRPTSGSIRFDGVELASMGDRELTQLRAHEIGFIFQGFNLIPTLTAAQNVEAVMAPLGISAGDQRARALQLLERVGLAPRADHLPSLLSGGEQQRVAVARALANNPRVVLADEPTGNLDTQTAAEVVKLLRSLTDDLGVTIVLVTHDRELAAQAPRRIRMRDGHIVGQAPRTIVAPVTAEPIAVTAAVSRLRVDPERATRLVGRAAAAVAVVGLGAVTVQSLTGASTVAASKPSTVQTAPTTAQPTVTRPTTLIPPAKDGTVIGEQQPTTPKTTTVTPVVQPVADVVAPTPKPTSTPKVTKPAAKPTKPVSTPTPTPTVTPPTQDDTTTTTTNLPGWPTYTKTTSVNPLQMGWWWPWNWIQIGSK